MDYREYRKKYGSGEDAGKTGADSSARPARDPKGDTNLRRGSPERTSTGSFTRNYRAGTQTGKKRRKKQDRNSATAKIVLFSIIGLTVVLILLSSLLVLTSGSFMLPDFLASKVTVEAGRASISASDFLIDKSHTAEFAKGTDYSLDHVGDYRMRITIDGGKTYTTKLHVKDSVPPVGERSDILVREGASPSAELCVKNIKDATKVVCTYKQAPDCSKEGLVNVTVLLRDEGGNVSEVNSVITVVNGAAVLVRTNVIECGDPVPDVTAFVGSDGYGKYFSDVSVIKTTVPGSYGLQIKIGEAIEDVTLIIQDTVAPKATVTSQVIYNDGPIPDDPSIFVSDVIDATPVTVTYDAVPQKTGTYPIPVKIRLTDSSGNYTVYDSEFTSATDYVAPTISVLSDTVYYTIGDAAIDWQSAASVSDNSGDRVTVTVDEPVRVSSGSHSPEGGSYRNTEGNYTFTITATDRAGNVSSEVMHLVVREFSFTELEYKQAVGKLVDQLTTPAMPILEKAKALYKYLSANSWSQLHYANESQHDDWKKEAYSVLTTIPNNAKGDCFAFASVAKAFFDYLGYDTIMIERSVHTSGTHFWVVVNMGTRSNPQWYHFDGTPMRGDVRVPAYALTDAQLNAYTLWRNDMLGPNENYYVFDKSLYDYTPSTKIVCPITDVPDKYYR